MKPTDNIERLVQSARLTTSRSLDDRILTESFEALARTRQTPPSRYASIIQLGRFLMKNRIARFATAAALIAAVGLGIASLSLLQSGVTVAYAFTDTVQAMHTVQSLHMKFSRTSGGQLAESWSEFDAAGRVARCRMDFPQTEDGHKIVFWQDNKASIWFKGKGAFRTIADQKVAQRMLDMAVANDPKMLIERLQSAQARGEARIETQMPAGGDQSIVLSVTQKAGDRRQVLQVDPASKLVTRIDNYRWDGEQYTFADSIEILDYNQRIDPAVFSPELPEGTIRIDETTQVIGLAQGEMTREQVAREVVRQLFQALIDKDYAKAGVLLGGVPASMVEQRLANLHVVRIVSVGEPVDHPRTRGLRVPTTVEIEKDGQVRQWSPQGPYVRQVESDRTRWQVIGGI